MRKAIIAREVLIFFCCIGLLLFVWFFLLINNLYFRIHTHNLRTQINEISYQDSVLICDFKNPLSQKYLLNFDTSGNSIVDNSSENSWLLSIENNFKNGKVEVFGDTIIENRRKVYDALLSCGYWEEEWIEIPQSQEHLSYYSQQQVKEMISDYYSLSVEEQSKVDINQLEPLKNFLGLSDKDKMEVAKEWGMKLSFKRNKTWTPPKNSEVVKESWTPPEDAIEVKSDWKNPGSNQVGSQNSSNPFDVDFSAFDREIAPPLFSTFSDQFNPKSKEYSRFLPEIYSFLFKKGKIVNCPFDSFSHWVYETSINASKKGFTSHVELVKLQGEKQSECHEIWDNKFFSEKDMIQIVKYAALILFVLFYFLRPSILTIKWAVKILKNK